jgi:hypothetical protein
MRAQMLAQQRSLACLKRGEAWQDEDMISWEETRDICGFTSYADDEKRY